MRDLIHQVQRFAGRLLLLTVALVTYSVKPVFMVNGERIEGEAASATVDHTVIGMRILVK